MNIRYNKYLDSVLPSDDDKNKECGAVLNSKPEDWGSYIKPYESRPKEFYEPIFSSKFPNAVNIS